jgi:hypothetical protein
LPGAFSGHNTYWWWGPPSVSRSTTLVVGHTSNSSLELYWRDCSIGGHIDNGIGIENQEQGHTIWICRNQRADWAAIWPDLKAYG